MKVKFSIEELIKMTHVYLCIIFMRNTAKKYVIGEDHSMSSKMMLDMLLQLVLRK